MNRSSIQHEDRCIRFVVDKKDYHQQFCHMYSRRLDQMRPLLKKSVDDAWNLVANDLHILDKIIDSETHLEKDCVLIGTIYKEMELKPSILDEYKEINGAMGGVVREKKNFASRNDVLILEDDSGRTRLKGLEAIIPTLVTGITIAVRGRVHEDDGSFHVNAWVCTPSTLPALVSAPIITAGAEKQYVMMLCGLEVGAPDANLCTMQLLVDFVAGRLGGPAEQNLSKSIVRVIIAGNSLSKPPPALKGFDRFTDAAATKKAQADFEDHQGNSSRQLDLLLAQLLGSCPVDVMPGAMDPANFTMPQQPLHPCLFQHSARFSTLNLATNPYEMKIGDRVFLGHSGQPVSDMLLQVMDPNSDGGGDGDEPALDAMDVACSSDSDVVVVTEDKSPVLDVLESSLRWGHIAPTAPDSLPCYPYLKEDPFVMEGLPDVLFSGMSSESSIYESRLVNMPNKEGEGENGRKVCLVSLPSFKKSGQVVLVEVNTLETQVISFPNF